jgi:hypothetical protein
MNSTTEFQHSLFSKMTTGERTKIATPVKHTESAKNSDSSVDSFAATLLAATLLAAAEKQEPEQAPPLARTLGRPAPVEQAAPKLRRPGALARFWSWLTGSRAFRVEKQMRITESLSLGEKRFVALLHVEGRKFLIGGSSSGVSLLTALSGGAADAALPIPCPVERLQ